MPCECRGDVAGWCVPYSVMAAQIAAVGGLTGASTEVIR